MLWRHTVREVCATPRSSQNRSHARATWRMFTSHGWELFALRVTSLTPQDTCLCPALFCVISFVLIVVATFWSPKVFRNSSSIHSAATSFDTHSVHHLLTMVTICLPIVDNSVPTGLQTAKTTLEPSLPFALHDEKRQTNYWSSKDP